MAKAHYIGDYTDAPLETETHWQVCLDALRYGSAAVVSSPAKVIIGSGISHA